MALKGDTKIKRKLTRDLKNDIRNLVIFMQAVESRKTFTLMGSFCPKKHIKIQMKQYGRVTSSDARFEEKLTLGSKNDIRNWLNFNAISGKSENLHTFVNSIKRFS